MTRLTALRGFQTRRTPQSQPIPGSDQVPNSAGGYAWTTDPWQRLRRFLVLGTDGGTMYIGEAELTRENAEAVLDLITKDGSRVVSEVTAISTEGRAPRNDQALFVLAMAAALGDEPTRDAAFDVLPEVARTGTHLFQFIGFMEQFGGWGRKRKRGIAAWYQRDPAKVAYQAVKYRQREGWTHRDVLRLARPAPPSEEHQALFNWIVKGRIEGEDRSRVVDRLREGPMLPEGDPLRIVEGFIRASGANTASEVAGLVREYQLPREAVPTEHLNTVEVWSALLESMPFTALIRNLATMTRVGLLTPTSDGTKEVLRRLADGEGLRRARVHPVGVLAALVTYGSGQGVRGQHSWQPIPQVIDALDAAFYAAFDNVEPTGKRILIGLDVSGSMSGHEIARVPGLSARVGATAMALVTASVEVGYEVVAFTSASGRGGYWSANREVHAFPISPRERLDDVVQRTVGLPHGGTDCALPMQYAMEHDREVDGFLIYTDNETWAGGVHPAQALREYRERSGLDSRLVVVGMASNGFSIADPNDPGMLDVVGFDTATPNLISDFVAGRV